MTCFYYWIVRGEGTSLASSIMSRCFDTESGAKEALQVSQSHGKNPGDRSGVKLAKDVDTTYRYSYPSESDEKEVGMGT